MGVKKERSAAFEISVLCDKCFPLYEIPMYHAEGVQTVRSAAVKNSTLRCSVFPTI